LWDGTTTWVLLEGHPADLTEERAALEKAGRFGEVDGPPAMPIGGRRSMTTAALRTLTGTFVAEIGVGTVHTDAPVAQMPVPGVALNQRIKEAFDPTGRLNPGRSVFA
jgi:hypothetical protein